MDDFVLLDRRLEDGQLFDDSRTLVALVELDSRQRNNHRVLYWPRWLRKLSVSIAG